MTGLLSELSAVGFERFVAEIQANVGEEDSRGRRLCAIGHGYVAFARGRPDLFLLMFRSERLDLSRPALRAAIDASARLLSGAVGARRGRRSRPNTGLNSRPSHPTEGSLLDADRGRIASAGMLPEKF